MAGTPEPSISSRVGGAPERSTATVWALDNSGRVFSLSACRLGKIFNIPSGCGGLQIVVSSSGGLWLVASDGRRYTLWHLTVERGYWNLIRSIHDLFTIAAAGDKVWLACGRTAYLLDSTGDHASLHLPFEALQLSEASDGTLWGVGGERMFGGRSVWRLGPRDQAWYRLPPPAAADRLAAARDGTAWTVNNRGEIWRLHPDGAGKFAECGLSPTCRACCYSTTRVRVCDLCSGSDGNLWFLEEASCSGGYVIRRMVDFASRISERVSRQGAISISAI
jgi:hypothetical protein